MHIALWIVQILLALAFGASGLLKLTLGAEELIANGMLWVETTGIVIARLAGAGELLGAVGLILPAALRIQPRLTGYAALGLVAVMIGAVATHVIRGEYAFIVMNVVLGLLAAFVTWGRLFAHPIAPHDEVPDHGNPG